MSQQKINSNFFYIPQALRGFEQSITRMQFHDAVRVMGGDEKIVLLKNTGYPVDCQCPSLENVLSKFGININEILNKPKEKLNKFLVSFEKYSNYLYSGYKPVPIRDLVESFICAHSITQPNQPTLPCKPRQ